uniref:non-specific serine/threonine protein kinase n=1 Tax=Strigamia maritima TaxID=126957 RepID=T1ISE1_STRMM
MGNQLTGIAPSQIFPVEYYLTELPEYTFDISLGSTRFLKVARAGFREGLVVVKVFAIHDPSFPLSIYNQQLEDIKLKISHVPNCHPFQKFILTEKAGLLFRQYVKDNLYDRISTRPFLNNVEKKWIAFQLLCALSQCHKLGVCHGDIKLENVMVTGWNWVLLTDFASFKPTYLPEDNPADYSYFFDTSRRRICYIAPERFVKTISADAVSASNLSLPDGKMKEGNLQPSMDIFSVGCALTELFTEGHFPFDLGQLLAYRNDEYNPSKVLERIEDTNIRAMLCHMIQKEPSFRLSTEGYLEQQRGRAFPEYFYSYLRDYMHGFAGFPIITADDKIIRLKRDLPKILKALCNETEKIKSNNTSVDGLVIILSLITSTLRALRQCSVKLSALEMMLTLTPHLSAEIILDRLTPYMLFLVKDDHPRVRAASLRVLTKCLGQVNSVPRSDANIFPEYILPNLSHLTHDETVVVRIIFAENIAELAEIALKYIMRSQIMFLEMAQLNTENDETDTVEDGSVHSHVSYDAELQALHEMIQQIVSTLLSDSDNIIKQTLMENGITRLCVFFGHQKANDILLSHMITFLNDKEDRHLRTAFFDCIVGVAAYVGWQSSYILKPLLQQGISDPEESVIVTALNGMANLTELGLLQKLTLYELLSEMAPLLCHPNLWIRHAAVGFVCAVARSVNVADIHCKLLPLILPFLKYSVIQVDKEIMLLSALKDPIPRSVYDSVIRSPHITALLESLHKRQMLRGITRIGHQPQYGEIDANVRVLHRRLVGDAMTEAVEDVLLLMREYLLKAFSSRSTLESKHKQGSEGHIDLARNPHILRHHATHGENVPFNRASRKKAGGNQDNNGIVRNEEWQHMFGAANIPTTPRIHGQGENAALMTKSLPQGNFTSPNGDSDVSPNIPSHIPRIIVPPHSPKRVASSDQLSFAVQKIQTQISSCQIELRELIYRKVTERSVNSMNSEYRERNTVRNGKYPPPAWKPKGLLVAHLAEHRSAVNRVLVIPDTSLFVTASNDGTVKIWDCGRMEARSIANRARQTYNRQGGQITSLAVCHNNQAIASASDNLTIHVFKYDIVTPKQTVLHTRTLDKQEDGCVVDMNYYDAGSQSVLTYATVYGSIYGWDLRSPGVAWKLENDPQHGLITSYCVDPHQSWLVAGTVKGIHVCWDIRFQLPISTLSHPAGARVRRLELHPHHHSWITSAVNGNNEVNMWDVETGARQYTLWASPEPPLSQTQASKHSVHALQVWRGETAPIVLTAGSDMRIRFWNLGAPTQSFVAVGAANDAIPPLASYQSRLIDGTEVICETYKRPPEQSGSVEEKGPDMPPVGHNDCISDLAICQTSQVFIISAARNGVVKVWK